MKSFFPTGGRPNLAMYIWVMSNGPLSVAGSRPIRQNFLPTVTPALQGREAETITPSARPEERRSLSAIRPPWLVITNRTIGKGHTLPYAGGFQGQAARVDFEKQPSPTTPTRPGREAASAIGAGLVVPGQALLLGEVIPRSRQRAHFLPRAALVRRGGLFAGAGFARLTGHNVYWL